jgi:thioredoxin 1
MDSMVVLGLLNRKKEKRDPDLNDLSTSEWPDYVITLDGKNFSDFIQKYPLSVVDFWALWCAPCRTMAPRLRRLSKIYKGKVALGKLDTQANEDIAKKYKIMGIPHLMFFRYGKKVSTVTGVRSVGDLKDIIDDLLKK